MSRLEFDPRKSEHNARERGLPFERAADGMPPLHADMDRSAWAEAFRVAYEGFCDAVDRGRETWLDPYAAEAPAEFFAVVSEAFFEAPNETRRRYPEVYEQLRRFYRQDPAARLAA